MSSKKASKKTARDLSAARERDDRRVSESSALARASSAYADALNVVSEAVSVLVRGAAALDVARASAVAPDLVQYGLAARLRPGDLQRAVHGVARDLSSKLTLARASDLVVPDGTEEAYGLLMSRLADASDLVSRALDEFSRSVPRSSSKPHPVVRDLILSAAGGASVLNRLVGRGRATASTHVSAVRDEIVSDKSVSFY